MRWPWIRRASLEQTEKLAFEVCSTAHRAFALVEHLNKRIEQLEGDLRIQTCKANHIQQDIMQADAAYLKGCGIVNDFGDENGVSK